jgi:hypothetical protein
VLADVLSKQHAPAPARTLVQVVTSSASGGDDDDGDDGFNDTFDEDEDPQPTAEFAVFTFDIETTGPVCARSLAEPPQDRICEIGYHDAINGRSGQFPAT